MAQQKWRAVILTQSNRLEPVEFVTPNNNIQDASAQCMMMFGAKEIKTIYPLASYGSSQLGDDDDDDDDRGRSGGSDISWEAIGFLLLIFLFISFWPYFLAAGAAFGIYKLVEYVRSTQ
jgi:hypothetical protein